MLLFNDVEDLIAERMICIGTQNQYRRSVRCYSEYLQEPAKRLHLKERTVNQWLASLDGRRSPQTIRGRKAGITAVWNWLARLDAVKHYNPNRLRRINAPTPPPRAWSVDNVRALLAGAADIKGTLKCGIKARDLLTAWVWIGYESGIRPSDMRELQAGQLGDSITIMQHKTGKPHTFRLSQAAIDAVAPLLDRPKVFGLPKSTIRLWEKRLFEAAELHGFVRSRGQALGTLRKTHATEVARREGVEAAARSLGHVSGTKIAIDSYVQADAVSLPSLPPSLCNHGSQSNSTGCRVGSH